MKFNLPPTERNVSSPLRYTVRMFNNETVLVTGVNGGIGQAIANRLIREGAAVVGVDLAVSGSEGLSSHAHYYQADLADPASIESLFSKLDEDAISVDGLVNNAGFNRRGTLLDISTADWDTVLNVNLRGTFLMCQYVARRMAENGGTIVNISSSAAKTGGKIAGDHYSIAKAGINALTLLLAKEVAKHAIRVNAVCPGPIVTPFHKETTDEEKETASRDIPLGRFGRPEEIASVVAFLLSTEASYITGEILDVNGGLVMELV